MKTTKTAVILLSLVLLIATHPVVAMDKPKISNTRIASCLFKITTSEAVLPLNEFVVDYLLRSSGVAGKAAREVLDISPDIASELFEIEEVFAGDSSVGGYGGGGYGGGGYGSGVGGMGLPADSTPGAFGYGATTTSRSTLGSTTTSSSTRKTTPTPAGTPTRTATTTRTPRPGTTTTTPTRSYPTRPTTRTRPKPRTPTSPPPRRKPTVTQPQPSADEQTILFSLRVDIVAEDIKPAAEEFMAALIENLRTALRGAFDQYSAKLNKKLDLADKEANRAQHELVQMQSELREISGSRDLSRQSILSDIRNVRQKLQSAKMKLASDETIYQATFKRIAEEQARRKKLIEDDPITREFKSMLDVHEQRLKDAQRLYKTGEVSIADVEDVKEKIIRARIELAKRQEEVSNPPGRLAISSTNDELANLSTKAVLAQQEINSFNDQLKEAEDLLQKADRYELLSLKADIGKQSLEESLLWRARLGRNIRSVQSPDVTVIGAE
jgi:hypothetical protein